MSGMQLDYHRHVPSEALSASLLEEWIPKAEEAEQATM